MAVTVNELVNQRSTTVNPAGDTSHTRQYDVKDAVTEDAAITAIEASPDAPTTLTVGGISLERRSISLRETEVAGDFEGSVSYVEPSKPEKNKKQKEAGQTDYTFDLSMPNDVYKVAAPDGGGGFQQKVWPPGTDLGHRPEGVVGVTSDDGSVEGAAFNHTGAGFSISKVFTNAEVTPAQLLVWREHIAKRNIFAFQGFAAKQCLLQSVRGQRKSNKDQDWDVTFDCLIDEDQVGVEIAGIPGITVRAFDYVEVVTKEVWLAPINRIRTQVVAVVTSTLFPVDNFEDLNI